MRNQCFVPWLDRQVAQLVRVLQVIIEQRPTLQPAGIGVPLCADAPPGLQVARLVKRDVLVDKNSIAYLVCTSASYPGSRISSGESSR
jgi:hypothetical protein